MLYPLTVAVGVVAFAAFTIYAFRLAIARLLGKAHRQIQEDKTELRREYHHGLGRDKN